MQRNRRWYLLAALFLLMVSAASGEDLEDRAARVREASTISYTGHYFQDAARILKEIKTQPKAVGARLQGGVRQAFEDAFGTAGGR